MDDNLRTSGHAGFVSISSWASLQHTPQISSLTILSTLAQGPSVLTLSSSLAMCTFDFLHLLLWLCFLNFSSWISHICITKSLWHSSRSPIFTCNLCKQFFWPCLSLAWSPIEFNKMKMSKGSEWPKKGGRKGSHMT